VDESPVIASVVSPQGRSVKLTAERWRYIQSASAIGLRCRAPFPFRWMRVVVEFAGDADRFVTAFGQDNDPEGLPR
jgi:hypothetical protein